MVTRPRQTVPVSRGVSLYDPTISPNESVVKLWKFRRNLVIYVAHRQGLSQRLLADVFDLPRSRIFEIVKEFRGFEPE
jgi:hypothetical protein